MSLFTYQWASSVLILSHLLAVGGLVAQQSPELLIDQANEAAIQRKHQQAITLATRAIAADPTVDSAYYIRGRERFRLGEIKDAVLDFDKYVELRPAAAPRQWERGIAYYYAGMYEKGARQFESYQEYDGNDVENSVWRFLCLVPTVGFKKAQSTMLPIDRDSRVPMMKIYDMYRGMATPEDVESAARSGSPDAETLAARMFYVHLYLGLWFEAQGNSDRAKAYIEQAADEKLKDNPRLNAYMWDVARIHLRLLRGELKHEREAVERRGR